MTTTVPNRFAEGELVDVALSGLRYADTRAGHLVLVGDAGRGDGEPYELVVPVSARMKVTRVAPKEWPPVAGDVWTTADGARWFARHTDAEDEAAWMVPAHGGPTEGRYAARLLEVAGPMRLAYRDGWTPDVEPEPAEVDERAATIAGLRAMADFLEANDFLPRTYGWGGQLRAEDEAHVHELAEQFGATVKYDNFDALAAEMREGPVGLTFYYAKPKPAASDVDEAAEMPDVPPEFTAEQVAAEVPAEVRALADRLGRVLDEPTSALPIVPTVDDESDGRCTGFLLEYVAATNTTSHHHKCEMYGDDHSGNHICLCGTEWENEPAEVQAS